MDDLSLPGQRRDTCWTAGLFFEVEGSFEIDAIAWLGDWDNRGKERCVGAIQPTGVLTIYTEKPEIKWFAPFRSELSGESGRSCEAIHISRSFRFSRSVCEPFQLPALFKIFLAGKNKMADHGGNE